ncbi:MULTISPECIES: DUF6894 family protein [Novosphingobium]|uniref:DUF6894 family protein n=1 Tax=Novosphingobium TaxID=165696 RepID=UPI0022F2A1EC|nr:MULTISPECIES: hypothetical protein [Novosphingobium]GLK46320.1 hypothetical protein GCM10017612_42420 [Novosphingobium resinovorum]
MPRYFFHVLDGKSFPDLQGTVLEGLAEVRLEAIRFAGDLLVHAEGTFWQSDEWSIEVNNSAGSLILSLNFKSISEVPEIT